jgi:hypothetical protein
MTGEESPRSSPRCSARRSSTGRSLTTRAGVRAAWRPGSANVYQFYSDASEYFTGVRDLNLVRELNPDLQSLDSWLNEHKSEIPLG